MLTWMRGRNTLRFAPALWLLLALAACSPASDSDRLHGRKPTGAAFAGNIVLPEVRPGEPSREFTLRAPPGELLFVYFGFVTCPDVCPTTLADLERALGLLGEDASRVEVAFITVDLNRDSAAVLAPYIESFVEGGHALLPSTQGQLGAAEAALGATSSVVRQPDGSFEVSHTPMSYLVDDGGHVVLEWRFGIPAEDMAHDLRVLLERPAVSAPAVTITGAWARPSPAMAPMGAAYLTLRSSVADRLLAVDVPDSVAARAELHEVITDASGRMKMQRSEGIALPAGSEVRFVPGALHIMLIELARPLLAGDTLALTLSFEKAGAKVVAVPVRATP